MLRMVRANHINSERLQLNFTPRSDEYRREPDVIHVELRESFEDTVFLNSVY
tara:strand:- start:449 stop:604 length:156 start_codon:yes stop_codon:yes gene_type:complete